MTRIEKNQLTTLILAGGKSSRMGGVDKGLLKINDKYLVCHLESLAKKYSNDVLVNVNRNIDTYESLGLNICKDFIDDFQGPLAGMYTGLRLAKTKYIITMPCDGPFVKKNYFQKMIEIEEGFNINVAYDGDRIQPVYSLINCDLINSLDQFLKTGQRKIDKWYSNCSTNQIDFSDDKEMFININDQNELKKYENIAI